MSNALSRLLPVHDARERRALRHSHELALVHQRALRDQLVAQRAVLRLKRAHAQAQALALGSDTISAHQALAAIEFAAALLLRTDRAQSVLDTRAMAAREALDQLRQARAAYAQQVRVSHMMSDAAAAQARAQAHGQAAAQELRDEDEFAPVWLARQRLLTSESAP